MRPRTPAPGTAAATATVCVSALLAVGVPSASAAPDPSKESRKFRDAVTATGVAEHLDAFQAIATEHGGNRASGTPGYDASRDYVVERLRAAGYMPTMQTFTFPHFEEDAPAQLARVAPGAKDYTNPDDFATMRFSGSGDVAEAGVVPVDTDLTATDTSTSGCEVTDFATFPAGSIALLQRGTCPFRVKAENAHAAGAVAVIVFNKGTEGSTATVQGTLGEGDVVDLPVLGASFAVGQELGATGTTARVFTATTNQTRITYNVLAQTAAGDPNSVVMTGAHLDSVDEGPGINDNGSGSAALLEIAEELAPRQDKLTNRVRFAWWGAEEAGLVGSTHYVDDLYENNRAALADIAAYLNYDMVGSPNYVRFVYDGDNSNGGGATGPDGSAQIEEMYTSYFSSQGLASEPTPFSGRSDYGPFIAEDIPAGGLFTGAEGVKTEAQAATYGGTAGAAYDACYHSVCDDRSNISMQAIDEMTDAAAHAVFTLANSTASMGQPAGTASKGKRYGSGPKPESKGHRLVR